MWFDGMTVLMCFHILVFVHAIDPTMLSQVIKSLFVKTFIKNLYQNLCNEVCAYVWSKVIYWNDKPCSTEAQNAPDNPLRVRTDLAMKV